MGHYSLSEFAVSTAWVYRKMSAKLTKLRANTSIAALLRNIEKDDKLLINDSRNRYT